MGKCGEGAKTPTKKINGWNTQRSAYSDKTISLIKSRLPSLRKTALGVLPPKSEAGDRFNTDERVLLRLTSAYTENEFLIAPDDYLIEALEECAISDYHYNRDKDWGANDE